MEPHFDDRAALGPAAVLHAVRVLVLRDYNIDPHFLPASVELGDRSLRQLN